MPTYSSISLRSFDKLLGIQPDMNSGNWSSMSIMESQLRYVGAETARVAVPTAKNWTTKEGYNDKLASDGFRLEFVVDTSSTPEENVAAIASFVTAHPGSVVIVEAPNEPNNFGVNYAGKSGIAGALAWQDMFFKLVNANPATASITVAGMSSWPLAGTASDVNNLHVYPQNGDQPMAYLKSGIADQAAVDPGKAFLISEMGWSTQPVTAGNGAWGSVSETVQAKLILNAYMDAAALGAQQLTLYNLRDYPYTDFGAYFGLFRADNTPKPAAVALHNLQTILDTAATTVVVGAVTPTYTISGAADVHSMLITGGSGGPLLALWREPDIWDQATHQAITVPGQTVTVTTSTSVSASWYDPLAGSGASALTTSGTTFSITVVDHPIFVSLAPAIAPVVPVSVSVSVPVPVPVSVSVPVSAPVVAPAATTAAAVHVPALATAPSANTASDVTTTAPAAPPTVAQPTDSIFTPVSLNLAADASVTLLSTIRHAATDRIDLVGNHYGQTLIGNYGDNIIIGNGGADTLLGLFGNDIYAIDDARAIVIENAGEGTDVVLTRVSYALNPGASIETLSTIDNRATNAIDLTGNEFGQLILGNFGDNIINGGAGPDTLMGFEGSDTFRFSTALGNGNVDTIVDFESGVDRISLSSSIFAGIPTGTLSASAFVNGVAATTPDQHIIYNQVTGQLLFDLDGSGSSTAQLFATVAPGTILNPDMILIV